MNNTKIITVILIVAILGLGGYVFLNKNSTQPQVGDNVWNLPRTKIFSWDNSSVSAKIGQQFTVSLKANGGMTDVTGFDIVLKYDPKFGSFQKHTVLGSNFDAYVRQETGMVIVTAVKKMSVTIPVSLTDEKVIELSFTPAKAGSYVFEVVPQEGKAKTKIVDSKSSIINQDVTDTLTVTVQ